MVPAVRKVVVVVFAVDVRRRRRRRRDRSHKRSGGRMCMCACVSSSTRKRQHTCNLTHADTDTHTPTHAPTHMHPPTHACTHARTLAHLCFLTASSQTWASRWQARLAQCRLLSWRPSSTTVPSQASLSRCWRWTAARRPCSASCRLRCGHTHSESVFVGVSVSFDACIVCCETVRVHESVTVCVYVGAMVSVACHVRVRPSVVLRVCFVCIRRTPLWCCVLIRLCSFELAWSAPW